LRVRPLALPRLLVVGPPAPRPVSGRVGREQRGRRSLLDQRCRGAAHGARAGEVGLPGRRRERAQGDPARRDHGVVEHDPALAESAQRAPYDVVRLVGGGDPCLWRPERLSVLLARQPGRERLGVVEDRAALREVREATALNERRAARVARGDTAPRSAATTAAASASAAAAAAAASASASASAASASAAAAAASA